MAATAKSSVRAIMRANPYLNIGRQRNFITGIQGVSSGGQAQINFATDRRYHRLLFQCSAINYTGSGTTPVALTKITGAGVGTPTGYLTIVNGVPTAITISTGGTSGFAQGDTLSIADASGAGLVITVATVSSGAIVTATVPQTTTAGCTPTAISPSKFCTTVKLLVNGVNICDLTAAQEISRNLFNGMAIGTGQLPILFTEPWRNLTRWPEITSWDMAGQNSFQIQIAISPTVVSPQLTGIMEFDYVRNTVAGPVLQTVFQSMLAAGNAPAPILMPISRHAFTFQINAGMNLIGQGQIPFNYPILRLFLVGSSPGNITQLEIDQDSNKVLESFIGSSLNGSQVGQEIEALGEYGFVNSIFDAAYVADISQRIAAALKCTSNLQLKIYSTVAQSLTIIQEKLPKSYSS